MRNIRLTLAYDGTDFHGWQRQPDLPTVQQQLEDTLLKLIQEEVQVTASGRTDAGVHAANQVANFKAACRIPCANLVKALNDALPPTIRVKDAVDAAEGFHARYDARSKTYRYRIVQSPVCSPFLWRFVYHYPYPLNTAAMAEAARLLEGEHDFTSFAAAEKQDSGFGIQDSGGGGRDSEFGIRNSGKAGAVRRIFFSRVKARSETSMLVYDVSANGFLHHMVRNIVGTLLEVGREKFAPADMARIMQARDRTLAGPTAPAQGLCLMKVEY